MTNRLRAWVLGGLAAATLTGCTPTAPYQRPAMEMPETWSGTPAAGIRAPGERWWTLFEDRTLEQLIDEALAHNLDLALAAARVDEARAQFDVADSLRSPAITAATQSDRARVSNAQSAPAAPNTGLERNNHRGTLNVAYEVDLWGRLRSATNAARAELLATEAAQQTVRISLIAEVVRAYYALVAGDAQIAATRRTLALRTENLRLQRLRAGAGLISDLDLRQLEAELATAQAQLPALQRSLAAAEAGLSVLLGRQPRAIMQATPARTTDNGSPSALVIPEGLPSDLLLRRPDVISAEQRLIAANARIAMARAALFPRISLTAYLGGESAALGDLLSGPARIWQLAFGLAQPIFQAGRLFSEIEVQQARERQAVLQYQQTLQQAFSEVRAALAAQMRSREIIDAEHTRATALRETLRLARIRYENGLSSQLEVLDAERNLLLSELNRAEALRAQRVAVADVMKALGGGWDGPSRP